MSSEESGMPLSQWGAYYEGFAAKMYSFYYMA